MSHAVCLRRFLQSRCHAIMLIFHTFTTGVSSDHYRPVDWKRWKPVTVNKNTTNKVIIASSCFFFFSIPCFVLWVFKDDINLMLFSSEWLSLDQSSSWQSRATPRLTQCWGGLLVGSVMEMTKLVECPVVERVPLLSLVLYRGQTYSLCCWPQPFFSAEGKDKME